MNKEQQVIARMEQNVTRNALVHYVKAWQRHKEMDRQRQVAWDNAVSAGNNIPYGTPEFVALTLDGKTYVIHLDVDDWNNHTIQEIETTYQGETA